MQAEERKNQGLEKEVRTRLRELTRVTHNVGLAREEAKCRVDEVCRARRDYYQLSFGDLGGDNSRSKDVPTKREYLPISTRHPPLSGMDWWNACCVVELGQTAHLRDVGRGENPITEQTP